MRNTFFFAIFAPKTKKTIIILFFLLAGLEIMSAKPLRIVSYNVENLFHPAHDSVYLPAEGRWMETDDLEWTPDGERRWTYSRYHQKVHNIAKVLTIIGQWDGVDMVGLCEVENAEVVRQLCHTMRYKAYDFVHYESPDRRGIDVALIYKPSGSTLSVPEPYRLIWVHRVPEISSTSRLWWTRATLCICLYAICLHNEAVLLRANGRDEPHKRCCSIP